MIRGGKDALSRRSFWTATAFYIVIGFEFLYMAGPFAAYFYSIYGPGLNFLHEHPLLSWLTRFFMPHIVVETSSVLINRHNVIGASLAVLGFASFLSGACQVYYHKLAKKGPVTGGVYRVIRHPQYASFALWGFGLLLLWPRYIVLVMFITMLFGYYCLARVEERECEEKYGESYREYRQRTAMFIPLPLRIEKLPRFPPSGGKRIFAQSLLFISVLAVGITGARFAEHYSLNSLYTYSTPDSVTVSVVKVDPKSLENIVAVAIGHQDVRKRLMKQGRKRRYLNYVLPAEWYVSEVPMETKEGFYHLQPEDYDRNLYKIIFTEVELRGGEYKDASEFLGLVIRRLPVAEVWIDLGRSRVTEVKDPPHAIKYENIPVALY